MTTRQIAALASLLLVCITAHGADDPALRTFDVAGVKRQAIVVSPSEKPSDAGAPLVFVFHGHGGTGRLMHRRLAIHELWPRAVVVYPQGIPGVVGITDKEGKKSGWQKNPGDVEDRDINFFDVMLKEIRSKATIDDKRIYAMGHSNGSRFVNVLWATRGDTFAAVCSSGGQGGLMIRDAKPLPVFVIAGEKDNLVPFEGQMRSVELIRRLLAVDTSRAKDFDLARIEPGKDGLELCTYLHPGGHAWPTKITPVVVKFFQRHAKK